MNYLVIPDSFWSALGYAGTALALVAGAIIAQAIWGGRRGWMPTCRKCGHDLRAAAAETTSCPECGADLSRPGAVRTGGARVRPVRLGFGVVLGVVAGFLVWYLQPERIDAIRARAIASTPLDRLIESVLGGGSGDELALQSLDARSGSGGRTRTIPPGELLDGFVAAIARHDESKRGPIDARLPKLRMVASALDRDECARLAQLVAEQVVESDGTDRRLLKLAVLAQQSGGSATSGLRSAIRERLHESDDGRRLLMPTLPTAVVASSRRALELEFSTTLSDMETAGRSTVLEDGGRFLLERAEYTPAGSGAGAVEFRTLPLLDGAASVGMDARTRLLVDAPVGKGRLVLTGVFVPPGASPSDAPLTAESARDIAGATPHTMETTLQVQAPRIFKPVLVTDQAVLDAVARSCGSATFGGRAGETPRFQVDILARSGRGAGVRSKNYSFDVLVAQDGSTWRMGSLAGGARSRSIAGDAMPKAVDPTRPFEVVLRPDLARVAMLDDDDDARMMGGEFVWAEFRLKFPNSMRPPKVEWAALPTERPTLEPIEEATGGTAEGGTLEQRLQRLAAMLVPLRLGDGAPASPELGLAIAATDVEAAALARSLPLCGILEVLSTGALIAPERVVMGGMLDDGSSSYRLPSDLGDAPTIVVRYTPDPELAMPTAEGTMRFVALPFELVYEGGKAPVLRVLPKRAR